MSCSRFSNFDRILQRVGGGRGRGTYPHLIRQNILILYIFLKNGQLQVVLDAIATERSPILAQTSGEKIDLSAWFNKILF